MKILKSWINEANQRNQHIPNGYKYEAIIVAQQSDGRLIANDYYAKTLREAYKLLERAEDSIKEENQLYTLIQDGDNTNGN